MPNTLFTGKVSLYFEEIPSTNDLARQWIVSGGHFPATNNRPPEGAVVRAASQSAGRGQFGSIWESAAGQNLTFSVIYYPVWLAPDRQFDLSRAVALACMLEDHWQIKWPNDIYLGGKKAGGILIENQLQGGKIVASIIGIGLNVNQTHFPASLPNATSMALSAARTFDLDSVFDRLLERLEQAYLDLRAGRTELLRAHFRQRLFRLDQAADFLLPDGTPLRGVLRGVADDGRLLLETATGMASFGVKEIAFCV
jgi:BirA family biotin operon repressor/biotin-[acetyl-CoA-carboxylase] ligase